MSGWMVEHHTLRVPSSANREERALDVALDAIDRVLLLAENARAVISRGCTCYGPDCTGKCRRGEPLGWDLDPAEVLRVLNWRADQC